MPYNSLTLPTTEGNSSTPNTRRVAQGQLTKVASQTTSVYNASVPSLVVLFAPHNGISDSSVHVPRLLGAVGNAPRPKSH